MLTDPIFSQALRGSSCTICEDSGADKTVVGYEFRIDRSPSECRRRTQEWRMELEMADG